MMITLKLCLSAELESQRNRRYIWAKVINLQKFINIIQHDIRKYKNVTVLVPSLTAIYHAII